MKIRICAITGRVHLSSAVIMKRFSRVTFNSSRPYLHKRIILDMGSMFGFSDILDYLCIFFFFFFCIFCIFFFFFFCIFFFFFFCIFFFFFFFFFFF